MAKPLVLTRQVGLPPAACFALWTDRGELAEWWGPTDDHGTPFRAEVHAWTAKPGEAWSITLTAPDGSTFKQAGTMLEVEEPRLIRFTFSWVEDGRPGPETKVRVTFEANASGTLVTVEHGGFDSHEAAEGHRQGWQECLDRFLAAARDKKRAYRRDHGPGRRLPSPLAKIQGRRQDDAAALHHTLCSGRCG